MSHMEIPLFSGNNTQSVNISCGENAVFQCWSAPYFTQKCTLKGTRRIYVRFKLGAVDVLKTDKPGTTSAAAWPWQSQANSRHTGTAGHMVITRDYWSLTLAQLFIVLYHHWPIINNNNALNTIHFLVKDVQYHLHFFTATMEKRE